MSDRRECNPAGRSIEAATVRGTTESSEDGPFVAGEGEESEEELSSSDEVDVTAEEIVCE